MTDLPKYVKYDNPGLDAELLAALEELLTNHGLDSGRGGRGLTAAVVVRWEYPDDPEPDRFVLATGDSEITADMFFHGAAMFSRE